ncbi:MAG: hypothetical protein K2Q14_03815 [Gammaproteobacteria bacterium]|nr:hypothetical protein [Gammaproteobacteria bacterium]
MYNGFSILDKSKLKLLESNRVVVRIWTSGSNPLTPGHSVGHVSLEIPGRNIYLSLWPYQGKYDEDAGIYTILPARESEGSGLIKGVSSEDLSSFTFEKDLDFEGRKPEITLCLYTLSVSDMVQKYDDFLKTPGGKRWSLLGFKDSASCASAAWDILVVGNIRALISAPKDIITSSRGGSAASAAFFSGNYQGGSKGSSLFAAELLLAPVIKSPDALSLTLKEAKKLELAKEPLLQHLTYDDETLLEAPSAQVNNNNNNNAARLEQ